MLDKNYVRVFAQDVMGQIVTYELIPGGRGVAVTNENKIRFFNDIF